MSLSEYPMGGVGASIAGKANARTGFSIARICVSIYSSSGAIRVASEAC